MFCALTALFISWLHLNHPNSLYQYHVFFFHLWIIRHHLGFPSSHDNAFSMVQIYYVKRPHYSYCCDFDVNVDEIWMKRDWFYTTVYGSYGDGGKVTQRSPRDNLIWLVIIQSKGYTKKFVGKLTRSVRIYFYLVFISQIQARSGIVGNSESAVHTQQVLQSTFNALINIEYSINVDIDSYQSPFKCALSKKKNLQ